MSSFVELPEDLQGCCTHILDISSAGRAGQASKACQRLVGERLIKEKAARAARATPFENSTHGAIMTYRNPNNDYKLITFFDGGLFKCGCTPDKEFLVGRGFCNVACHLASRKHWMHWRLVAFGEAQPAESEWLAFAATQKASPTRRLVRWHLMRPPYDAM